MRSFTYTAFLVAMLAAPAVAQDTGTDTEAPEAPEETAAQTETGEAAENTPQETIVSVHDDWQVRCSTAINRCYLYQLAIDAREIPVAEVSVEALDPGARVVAGFTVITPLKTLLTEGLAIQIDNNQIQKYQYSWCTAAGCSARFGVTENGLAAFKRGNKARLTVISMERPDAPVILDVSLKGFTAAFNALATVKPGSE